MRIPKRPPCIVSAGRGHQVLCADSAERHSNLSTPVTWVDNTSGLGAELPGRGAGDTRFYYLLSGTALSDSSGVVRIDLHLPATVGGTGATDRFHLDGYAVEMATVPEPCAAALGGLGVLGLLPPPPSPLTDKTSLKFRKAANSFRRLAAFAPRTYTLIDTSARP